MSRANKGTASEGQVPVQQEAAVSPFLTEQLLKEIQEAIKVLNEKSLGLEQMKKGDKGLSVRIQELELKVQRSPVGNAGSQEEKSGKRVNHATEAGGQEITPPEQQSRQAESSLYGLSPFYQLEQPRQQPPPLPHHYSQPFAAPEPFRASRQNHPITSAVGEQAHQPLPIARPRGFSSAGDPITLSWKFNPPVFDGDSFKFKSFRKEATTFADC